MEHITAWDRDERDVCEKLTPGCSVDHRAEDERDRQLGLEPTEGECATW